MVTVLEDSDVKAMGKFSEESLADRYLASLDELKAAEPAHGGKEKFRPFKAIKEKIQEFDSIDESMSSNNWVIHGKHTSTGMPMLASDPHLGTSIPSFWTLNELIWDEHFMIGGSVPGVPLIGIGRSKSASWGQTAPLADTSDLWQETIDETGTKYKVDGEWKDLKVKQETILVKGAES
jgi:penicillin G amidase